VCVPTLRRNILSPSSRSSKTLVHTYQTAWCHKTQDHNESSLLWKCKILIINISIWRMIQNYYATHSTVNPNDVIAFNTKQRTCEVVTDNFSFVVKRETTKIKHKCPSFLSYFITILTCQHTSKYWISWKSVQWLPSWCIRTDDRPKWLIEATGKLQGCQRT
jgi:hypothetical protein